MEYKKITIIIPCRNEEKFIEKVIKSILNQTYPKDKMEVFFVDGMSEDNTRKIIEKYSRKYDFIKLIKNPYKYVPYAMNLGIKNASGDIIIRMDAHSEYPNNYIEKLVNWLEKLKADNVGGIGITIPRSNSLKARAIALSLSHPFGVGNSLFRIVKNLNQPIEVDTVPFGCYRKEIFDEIGLYNEHLIRNQDIELNKRLKKFGGKIYLVPDVKIKYYARDNWKALWKNNFANGRWVILTAFFTKDLSSLSLRHFIPLIFVLYLFLLPILGLEKNFFIYIPLIIYLTLNLVFSIQLSIKNKNFFLFPYIFISFIILHLSYGMGSLYGILEVIFKTMRKLLKL